MLRHLAAGLFACLVVAVPTWIHSQDTERVERTLEVYDIAFLVRQLPNQEVGLIPNIGDLGLGANDEYAASAPISFSADFEEESAVGAPPGVTLSPDSLSELITRTIAEDSWSNRRNSIVVEGSLLLVKQTPDVQVRIAGLLAALRAQRLAMVSIDVAVVPPEAVAGIDGPALSREEFEAVIERAGERGTVLAMTAFNEQRAGDLSGSLRATADDTEVNQTGVIPVTILVVRAVPLGLVVNARATAIRGSDLHRLDLEVASVEAAGEVSVRETHFATLELVPLREESVRTSLVVSTGGAVLAGVYEDGDARAGEGRFAVLASVRPVVLPTPEEKPPVETDPSDFVTRIHDLWFLAAGLRYEQGEVPFADEDENMDFVNSLDSGRDPGAVPAETWSRLIEESVAPEAWLDQRAEVRVVDERFLSVTARAETQSAVAAWIAERLRERARSVTVEFEQWEGPVAAVTALSSRAVDGGPLPDDWRQQAVADGLSAAFRSRTSLIAGGGVRVRGFEARSFVADVECVSGGTGFAIIELPDAVVQTAGTGFTLDARVDSQLDPQSFRLEVDWQRCETRFERTATFRALVPVLQTRGEPMLSGADPVAGPLRWQQLDYVLDLPQQHSRVYRGSVIAQVDVPVLLKIEKGAGGSARALVATVRAAGDAGSEKGGER